MRLISSASRMLENRPARRLMRFLVVHVRPHDVGRQQVGELHTLELAPKGTTNVLASKVLAKPGKSSSRCCRWKGCGRDTAQVLVLPDMTLPPFIRLFEMAETVAVKSWYVRHRRLLAYLLHDKTVHKRMSAHILYECACFSSKYHPHFKRLRTQQPQKWLSCGEGPRFRREFPPPPVKNRLS